MSLKELMARPEFEGIASARTVRDWVKDRKLQPRRDAAGNMIVEMMGGGRKRVMMRCSDEDKFKVLRWFREEGKVPKKLFLHNETYLYRLSLAL